MGFFSWNCAKTGLPIMAALGSRTGNKLDASDVVLLASGSNGLTRVVERGRYDGYGRIDGEMGGYDEIQRDIERGLVRLVLAAFYDPAADRWSELPVNRSERGQGYFHDSAFVGGAFWRARAAWIEAIERRAASDSGKGGAAGMGHRGGQRFFQPVATQWFDQMDDLRAELREVALTQVVASIAPGWRVELEADLARRMRGEGRKSGDWESPLRLSERMMGLVHHMIIEAQSIVEAEYVDVHSRSERVGRLLARLESEQAVTGVDTAHPPLPDPGWALPPILLASGLAGVEETIAQQAREAVFDRWTERTGKALAGAGHERWWLLSVEALPQDENVLVPLDVSDLCARTAGDLQQASPDPDLPADAQPCDRERSSG